MLLLFFPLDLESQWRVNILIREQFLVLFSVFFPLFYNLLQMLLDRVLTGHFSTCRICDSRRIKLWSEIKKINVEYSNSFKDMFSLKSLQILLRLQTVVFVSVLLDFCILDSNWSTSTCKIVDINKHKLVISAWPWPSPRRDDQFSVDVKNRFYVSLLHGNETIVVGHQRLPAILDFFFIFLYFRSEFASGTHVPCLAEVFPPL